MIYCLYYCNYCDKQMYTFLIIDDEPVVRDGISETIDWQSHGFRLVGACRDGREGLQTIEELRPDVVMTDICMPFVDGLELAAFITERYPTTKTILLTGYDEFEYAKEAVRLKVNDFLLKPITADELRTKLDSVRAELDLDRRKREDLDRLQSQLRESLPLLRERFLNRLIRGDLHEADIVRRSALLELSLPGPCFNLLLIDSDRVDWEDDLTGLKIQNEVEAVSRTRSDVMVFRSEREQLVLLMWAPDEPAVVLGAIEYAEELAERVRTATGATVSIGIGFPVRTLRRIDESFRGARTALGQRLILGPNQIITAEQVHGSRSEPVPRAEQGARARVIREFRNGSSAGTETAIRELIELYRTTRLSMKECFVGIQRLLADLLSALESLGVHHSQVPEVASDPFGRLTEMKTLEDIERWFCELQLSARAVLARQQRQQSAAKAVEAEDYIQAHYAEPELSLTALCRVLSISKSYFSPMFKAHTGMTFVEYLTNLRMDRAKELLILTDMKGYEVAERVGFTDAHYFSLTFRKQTGVSPTEYRDSVQPMAR